MKKIILLLALGFLCQPLYPQRTEYPQIGAQVFIEPGQTDKQIDGFFRILAQHGFETARIRMFGAHMLRPDGSWDFTLYDKAFDAAGKHGVKLFATLFPPTDELGDVGGFKFPRSKAHLLEIAGYIEAVVSHFRGHPALDTWVLQNEPGTGGTGPGRNDLTDEVFARWKAAQKTPAYDNGYLKADFTQERFHTDFTTWYLGWIASQVDLHDPAHHKHINPHQLLDNLADYDFPAYEGFLTSLGVSMHLSWHFGYFTRAQYPLGISLMADIIRSGAGKNPFWITEMQGGNVTASGREVLCPTAREITQWLWTGIAAGAEGVIFWTLNQRASALEAGEWGMLDFQGRPSDRLTAASEVARTAKAHKSFFREARPVRSGITLLYNTESLRTQQKNAAVSDDGRYEGRKASATMKSLAGAYEAIAAWGVVPEVCEMDAYDWSDPQGKTIVLTNLVALPSGAWERLDDFVRKGGRMIATGLTGFYDQNMHCILMDDFPLRRCFGAQISEYKAVAPYFTIACDTPATTLPAHLWKGILTPDKAQAIAMHGGDVVGTRHRYGKGEAVWLPSLVELGGWHGDNKGVADFYGTYCRGQIDRAPLHFSRPADGVLMRLMESPSQRLAVLVNKRPHTVEIGLSRPLPASARRLCGEASPEGASVRLGAEECAVFLWDKQAE